LRCLVIEDDAAMSHYVATGLREAGHTVDTCANGLDGLQLACNESWDLVVLDRLLPGGVDGLAILAQMRELGKATPVLILSALGAVDERVRGLKAGGDDYLPKPFAFSELLARVEALMRRGALQPPSGPLRVADLVLDPPAFRATRGGRVLPLQPREFRLLECLMRHTGQVVTRTMLLEAVWDLHFDPQTNVIDVQISRLRAKVDRGFEVPLIHTVRGVGYRIGDAPAE
jgi:two-component system, OmpR family, response regulator